MRGFGLQLFPGLGDSTHTGQDVYSGTSLIDPRFFIVEKVGVEPTSAILTFRTVLETHHEFIVCFSLLKLRVVTLTADFISNIFNNFFFIWWWILESNQCFYSK